MFRTLSNIAILILSGVGCLVSLVLTYEHYRPAADIGCRVVHGNCASTVGSAYGHIGPIPTSILGLGMYLTFVFLCIQRGKALLHPPSEEEFQSSTGAEIPHRTNPLLDRFFSHAKRLDQAIWTLSAVAVCISWWLQYISFYVILSFCPWCVTSALLVTLIFLLASCDYLLTDRKLTGEQKLVGGTLCFMGMLSLVLVGPSIWAQIIYVLNSPKSDVEVSRSLLNILDYSGMNITGDPKAPYLIVEFADYQCAHCRKANTIVEKFVKDHPEKVRLGFRNFPLPQHNYALQAAAAAEAAGLQGKFWPMHDAIFAHQSEMEAADFQQDHFDDYAKEVGLDIKRFDEDRTSEPVLKHVSRDMKDANQARIGVTPTFFIITPKKIWTFAGLPDVELALNHPDHAVWQ